MKKETLKKIEALKDQFEEFRNEVEELLSEERDYIEELAENGRVSETSENTVACLSSMVESCESIADHFVFIFEFEGV